MLKPAERQSAAKLLTRDEGRRIAVPEVLQQALVRAPRRVSPLMC
jgi:hypothetical protein